MSLHSARHPHKWFRYYSVPVFIAVVRRLIWATLHGQWCQVRQHIHARTIPIANEIEAHFLSPFLASPGFQSDSALDKSSDSLVESDPCYGLLGSSVPMRVL